MAKSWFYLKDEQLCNHPGCRSPLGRPYPAYFDGLCAFCYAGSGPDVKAAALFFHKLLHEPPTPPPPEFHGLQKPGSSELPDHLLLVVKLVRVIDRFRGRDSYHF